MSPGPIAEIHPDTAADYGIYSGDEMWIETRKGKIRQTARITAGIRPGIVNAAYGWWFPEGRKEKQYEWERSGFNVLTSTEQLGKEYGTPNLKGINCRITSMK